MTRAPASARRQVHCGAATACSTETTRKPERGRDINTTLAIPAHARRCRTKSNSWKSAPPGTAAFRGICVRCRIPRRNRSRHASARTCRRRPRTRRPRAVLQYWLPRRHVRADAWRLRFRRGIRHRTQIPRNAAVPGGADFHEFDFVLHRRACAGIAKVLLMSLPLSGFLVVSVEQAVAAPQCTCRLADAGARVIKVERPEGDFARYYD